MIIQIKNTGGDWPMENETLVNNYLQIFVKFFKSIHLQSCNDALFKRWIGRWIETYIYG